MRTTMQIIAVETEEIKQRLLDLRRMGETIEEKAKALASVMSIERFATALSDEDYGGSVALGGGPKC